MHRKDLCWSWNSSTLATWCKELTHWKRPWCWERLKAGEGDDRGWDGWMASPIWWTWVWASSGNWWWTGKPGVLQSMGLQRVWHDWAAELNLYRKFSSETGFSFLFIFKYNFIRVSLLPCGLFSRWGKQGYSLAAVCRLPIEMASLAAVHGLQ